MLKRSTLAAALAVLLLPALVSPAVVQPSRNPKLDRVLGESQLLVLNLGTAQTGNVDTTNTADRGHLRGPALLEIVSTIGATPTVTVNVLGSMDGTNFFNVAYATTAAPETVAVAALTITTATTTRVILRPFHPWRFLKLNYSANTNVTLTANLYLGL